MNTLECAQKKALEIALAAAKMEKPSEIIDHLDDLLEILTGSKVFANIGLFKPPDLSKVILNLLSKVNGLGSEQS
ncbi:MAG: hypothetical protein OXL96_07825 [Candidatus Poribacteria bacterium]|nr:hypothetical protein [Candidatus Poribacteria bacterium]